MQRTKDIIGTTRLHFIYSIIQGIILMMYVLISSEIAAQDSTEVSQVNFFAKGRVNGYFFYQFGRVQDYNKDSLGNLDFSREVSKFANSLGLNLGIHLFELWYFRTNFYYQLNKKINASWINTDFTYALERSNWSWNSFSYGYVNYEVNRYGEGNKLFRNFLKGSYYFRYLNTLPGPWKKTGS